MINAPAFHDMTIDWLDSGARHVTRHPGLTQRAYAALAGKGGAA